MSNNALSTPSIVVNNVVQEIIPNSVTIKLGKGETSVRFASTGGTGGKSIHTQDVEGRIGMIKFEMYNTVEAKQRVQEWKTAIGSNAVDAVQTGETPISLSNASMVNDPEIALSADGNLEIEFQGDPISDT